MEDKRSKDQATDLRNLMHEIHDVEKNKVNNKLEEEEKNAGVQDLNVLNLPPRSQVHASKKTKTKWKISFPFARFLFVLFIIILGLMLTFNYWGKELLTTNIIHTKNNTNSAGELVTIKSGDPISKNKTSEINSKQSSDSPSLEQENEVIYYVVQEGDTLESIAIEYYGNEQGKFIIMEDNELVGDKLVKGQELVLSNIN